MIYDIILLAIFILLGIIGYVRGAIKSLIGIIISFGSYLLASMLAKLASAWIYTSFILPSIEQSVSDAVSGMLNGTSAALSDTVPQWLQLVIKLSGVDLSDVLSLSGTGVTEKITSVIDSAVQPVVTGFIGVLLTILLYLLFYFLLKLLAVRPIVALFELPVLNTFNRIMGVVLGLVEAFILVSMLAYLLKLVLPYIHTDVSFLNESTIYNSFIFYYFYSGNIFEALTGWIKL